jgi:nucleoside 2-deoxyribosyltransferase
VKKIYIAGPDVFEKNSIEIGKEYCKLCEKYGFIGLYPLDNVIDFNQNKQKIAQDIFIANKNLIQECDIVVANLNSFRGKESDSGTVWECGYGFALGKKVYGYLSREENYINQFAKDEIILEDGIAYDLDGKVIEDFDYPLNLMISCSVKKIVVGKFEDVLSLL